MSKETKNAGKTKNKGEPAKKNTPASKAIKKWLSLLAVTLAIGGVFSFGFVVFLANAFGESADTYNPIWMIYMMPLMFLIATPITIFIAKALNKHMDTLSGAMSDVAGGKKDVYIPTAKASAFTQIYEDFNKMAAEIAGIETLRTSMIDGFSHELKTPIASINGFAKMLLEDGVSEEKRRQYLEIIVKESDRLAGLAKNNLFLSKIDTQEIVTGKKVYDLSAQIREVAIALEGAWAAKNINLSAELPDVMYEGNADLMESVWQNLLSNAIRFTPKNGDINIVLKEETDCVSVSVSDTGIGMSQEVQARIFERYYQGDTSHGGEGHGLGLSIVKRIVKLAGGKINVDSRENEGSTFTVRLPK